MLDDVIGRLKSLGYEVTDNDTFSLTFAIGNVSNTIKNICNIDDIPIELYYNAVDMVCGEFLSAKKNSGQLDGFDFESAVKSIKEGDTTVTYAVTDGINSVDDLINRLINSGKAQLVGFRRLRW